MRGMRIRAITLDLDDTLWPIAPVMSRAEECLDAWLKTHCPRAAETYPILAMRELRDRIARENPHLAHDFTEQRKLSLQAALLPHGYDDAHVERAFTAFYEARNQIECYPDSLAALARLAEKYPLVSITNGNADLERIGMDHFFRHTITARGCGVAKPNGRIFTLACTKLNLHPREVLHVGDDPAARCGRRASGRIVYGLDQPQRRNLDAFDQARPHRARSRGAGRLVRRSGSTVGLEPVW